MQDLAFVGRQTEGKLRAGERERLIKKRHLQETEKVTL